MLLPGTLLQDFKNIYHLLRAILATFVFAYPASKLTVIGVTGTDGKTTTATMIYHILTSAKIKTALISTVAAYVGDQVIDTGFHTTTPNEWALQRLLRYIRRQGITHLVLESTSIGLDQWRLFGTNIQIAVYTNISHEHMDYHGSLIRYIKAKAKLARRARIAILNQEDTHYSSLSHLLPSKIIKVKYSRRHSDPITRRLNQLPLAPHNRSNALAAYHAVHQLGLDSSAIITAIKNFPGILGRLQLVPNSKGLYIYVDFAHTPNALKHVFGHLKQAHSGRLIAVFGATGRRDPTKRPLMGRYAARLADEIILTSDDNYDEDPRHIIRQIKAGVDTNYGHVHVQPDRHRAIRFALQLARPGDTVALLGQGHEQTINLDGKTETPWNDARIVKQLLSRL